MLKKVQILILLSIIAGMSLSACAGTTPTTVPTAVPTNAAAVEPTQAGGDPAVGESGLLPMVDPLSLSGAIATAGSSTVYPLAEAMAERFNKEGYSGQITIASIGSGAGFERFCTTGETDIANASRGIKAEEIANCAAINRTPIEFRVGTDALAIVVSSENDFLRDISLEELAKVFSSDAVKWSDVNPSWPAEDILRFSPGTDSGTFDFFVEAVMQPVFGKENDAAKLAILNAANTQFSEDDNVLVQGVEGSPYAIGYFGFAYFIENQGLLKAVSVNGVTPGAETAEDGSYKLARPLFIYSDADIMQSKPQVAAFINFFLTYVNEEIQEVGYFPASAEALEAAQQVWLDAMK